MLLAELNESQFPTMIVPIVVNIPDGMAIENISNSAHFKFVLQQAGRFKTSLV